MPRLTWGTPGEKFYETGISQAVLFVGSSPGVPWIGVTSIEKASSGGGARPYYLDGKKYLNVSESEEFEATINALNSPLEFAPCDGITSVQNGLFVTGQSRKSFGLSYKTIVGNDIDKSDHGYKIHIVYNALAAPSNKSNTSVSGSVNVVANSWKITSMAPSITGLKPTAYLMIDSRYTDPDILLEVEDILYGTEADPSRLPTPDELIALFTP
jgi:hypothetical protein